MMVPLGFRCHRRKEILSPACQSLIAFVSMNYEESISYIESLVPTLERPTLERMKLFVDEFDGLANQIPVFHVGGTNGKGSTAAILHAILSGTGFRVGPYT